MRFHIPSRPFPASMKRCSNAMQRMLGIQFLAPPVLSPAIVGGHSVPHGETRDREGTPKGARRPVRAWQTNKARRAHALPAAPAMPASCQTVTDARSHVPSPLRCCLAARYEVLRPFRISIRTSQWRPSHTTAVPKGLSEEHSECCAPLACSRGSVGCFMSWQRGWHRCWPPGCRPAHTRPPTQSQLINIPRTSAPSPLPSPPFVR